MDNFVGLKSLHEVTTGTSCNPSGVTATAEAAAAGNDLTWEAQHPFLQSLCFVPDIRLGTFGETILICAWKIKVASGERDNDLMGWHLDDTIFKGTRESSTMD